MLCKHAASPPNTNKVCYCCSRNFFSIFHAFLHSWQRRVPLMPSIWMQQHPLGWPVNLKVTSQNVDHIVDNCVHVQSHTESYPVHWSWSASRAWWESLEQFHQSCHRLVPSGCWRMKTGPLKLDILTQLADLTMMSLTHIYATQLKFWIDSTNWQDGENWGKQGVMTKQGRVQELHKQLAGYYKLDLSMLPANSVPVGPSTRDVEIQQWQWNDWVRLENKWGEAGEHFRLCNQWSVLSPPLLSTHS